jgi:hypothetical protein
VKESEMDRACSINWGEEECKWDIDEKARREDTTRKAYTTPMQIDGPSVAMCLDPDFRIH